MLRVLVVVCASVWVCFADEKAEIIAAEVTPEGDATVPTDPTEFEPTPSLAEEVKKLQDQVTAQQAQIQELTKNIQNLHDIGPYITPHFGYMHDDILMDAMSSRSYDNAFLVARPISIRLSQRDAIALKPHEQHGRLSARTKRRFVHFVVTVNTQNILQVFDMYQTEITRLDLSNESETHNAHLWGAVDEETTFVCDIISAQISGTALVALGRSDSPVIRVFAITAWRQFDKNSPNGEYIQSKIVEDMMMVPRFFTDEKQKGEGDEDQPTVSRVALYSKRRAKFFLASYSDVSLRVFRRNGSESSVWHSPNGTKITAMAFNNRKLEAVAVSDAGFQFVRLGRLRSFGPFCKQPNDTSFVSAIFDSRHSFRMYCGSIDGRIFVYHTKRMRAKDLCNPVDIINVQPKTPVFVKVIPGYIVAATSIGLHFYNTSSPSYQRPELQFVRRFDKELGLEEEFDDSNAPRLPQPLAGVATDVLDQTILVMAQTRAFSNKPPSEQKFGLIILDSYLPNPENVNDKKGFLSFFRGPMLLCIGVALFLWNQYNNKKQGGHGSPFGAFGRLLSKKTKQRHRQQRRRQPARHMSRMSDSDDDRMGGGQTFSQTFDQAHLRRSRGFSSDSD